MKSLFVGLSDPFGWLEVLCSAISVIVTIYIYRVVARVRLFLEKGELVEGVITGQREPQFLITPTGHAELVPVVRYHVQGIDYLIATRLPGDQRSKVGVIIDPEDPSLALVPDAVKFVTIPALRRVD